MHVSKKSSNNGFSLIEMLVVVVIVGIVTILALPAYNDYRLRADVSTSDEALFGVSTKMEQYYTLNGVFPEAADIYTDATGTLMDSPATLHPNLTFLAIQSSPLSCGIEVGTAQGILNYSDFNGGLMFQFYLVESNGTMKLFCLEGTAVDGIIDGQNYLGCDKGVLTTSTLVNDLETLVCP